MRGSEIRPPAAKSGASNLLALIAGFGGLLAMMAFAEIDGVRALQGIERANDQIRQDFLLRTRLLQRIRGDVYISGTYVRDYLLEPEAGKAEGHRYSLLETRNDMDADLASYGALLHARERRPFEDLTTALAEYWKTLDPVFSWSPAMRKSGGFAFLRDEVFPRRMAMLGIADRIRDLNEAQLNEGKLRVEQTFTESRDRLRLILGLTMGLGFLLAAFSIRRILGLESQSARQFREVQQLSARLVAAQEEERRSIARELHDEVGQSLTGVLVEMANLTTLVRAGDPEPVAAKAAEIKKLVEGSIGVVRNMALLLRPAMLDDLGLVPALEWQAREVSKRSGVFVTVDAEGVPEDLPEEHKTSVYRIVQEALHNSVQHAGATRIVITVKQAPGHLLVTIEDDGKGFDAARVKGMGLLGIEERVSHLGGTFTVESQPGKGAALRVDLPLATQ
jgi:signal transduction histidine kinase